MAGAFNTDNPASGLTRGADKFTLAMSHLVRIYSVASTGALGGGTYGSSGFNVVGGELVDETACNSAGGVGGLEVLVREGGVTGAEPGRGMGGWAGGAGGGVVVLYQFWIASHDFGNM